MKVVGFAPRLHICRAAVSWWHLSPAGHSSGRKPSLYSYSLDPGSANGAGTADEGEAGERCGLVQNLRKHRLSHSRLVPAAM